MPQRVKFLLNNLENKDDFIVAEVDAIDDGTVRVGRGGEIVATQTFEQAIKSISPVAEGMLARVKELSDPPDNVCVEFGLKLTATAGAIIAAAGTEGTFKVTLGWTRERRQSS